MFHLGLSPPQALNAPFHSLSCGPFLTAAPHQWAKRGNSQSPQSGPQSPLPSFLHYDPSLQPLLLTPTIPFPSLLFHLTCSAKPQIDLSSWSSLPRAASACCGRETTHLRCSPAPAKRLLPVTVSRDLPVPSQASLLFTSGLRPSPHSHLLYLSWRDFVGVTAWRMGSWSTPLPARPLWLLLHILQPAAQVPLTTQASLQNSQTQPLGDYDWVTAQLQTAPRAPLCFPSEHDPNGSDCADLFGSMSPIQADLKTHTPLTMVTGGGWAPGQGRPYSPCPDPVQTLLKLTGTLVLATLKRVEWGHEIKTGRKTETRDREQAPWRNVSFWLVAPRSG